MHEHDRKTFFSKISFPKSFKFIIDFNVKNNDELQGLTKFILKLSKTDHRKSFLKVSF